MVAKHPCFAPHIPPYPRMFASKAFNTFEAAARVSRSVGLGGLAGRGWAVSVYRKASLLFPVPLHTIQPKSIARPSQRTRVGFRRRIEVLRPTGAQLFPSQAAVRRSSSDSRIGQPTSNCPAPILRSTA